MHSVCCCMVTPAAAVCVPSYWVKAAANSWKMLTNCN